MKLRLTKRPGWQAIALHVAACTLSAACTAVPSGNRVRVVDVPLAASHADLMFDVTTGSRQTLECTEASPCAKPDEKGAAPLFIKQVQRVARRLRGGARSLYPDLGQRVPGLSDQGFDVYVVASAEPGSACSANGRIAVSSAFGTGRPSDDWVAFLIAREMGHVIARHPEEDSVTNMATSMLLNLVVPGSFLLKSAFSTGGGQLASWSKRDIHEEEADVIALDLLKASGYRPGRLATVLRKKPKVLNDGRWSKSFVHSSDFAIATVRARKKPVVVASR